MKNKKIYKKQINKAINLNKISMMKPSPHHNFKSSKLINKKKNRKKKSKINILKKMKINSST